jgi:hypothetical protein
VASSAASCFTILGIQDWCTKAENGLSFVFSAHLLSLTLIDLYLYHQPT